MRDVRRDRDADRRDVVVGRVPPARRVAAPPLQDRARRHSPQQPDRRLAVAREDPVLVLEGVDRARLHRLVVPVDRVRADPALAVVDDGALVVGSKQDERPVELEQVVLGEPVDLPSGTAVAVADHATKVALGGKHLRHCRDYPRASGGSAESGGEHRVTAREPVGAESSTRRCGSSAARVSPSRPRSMYCVATSTSRPTFGSTKGAKSPHWLGDPPGGSPISRARVDCSTSAAKLPAAENVVRPVQQHRPRAAVTTLLASASSSGKYLVLSAPFWRTSTISRRKAGLRARRAVRQVAGVARVGVRDVDEAPALQGRHRLLGAAVPNPQRVAHAGRCCRGCQ